MRRKAGRKGGGGRRKGHKLGKLAREERVGGMVEEEEEGGYTFERIGEGGGGKGFATYQEEENVNYTFFLSKSKNGFLYLGNRVLSTISR